MNINAPSSFSLLPVPREIKFTGGYFQPGDQQLILLDTVAPQDLRFAATRWQKALMRHLSLKWEMVASKAIPLSLVGITLRINPERLIHPQGYEITITQDSISVEAKETAGVFYAICTLIQILEQCETALPCARITDWPDFPVRGVMLDVSRDKVPTMETMYALLDRLAGWKINQFQLYTEHTFAYRQHPLVWENASPFTGQEILEMDAFCRERHIELVPNQNSFGHLHHWLIHPRYAPLAEVTEGFHAPWGYIEGPFSLAPSDKGSLELISGLYDELLPHFSSRMVNVGCDETFDLGQGRSKAEVDRHGSGQVYLDFLLQIYQNLKVRGYTMQFWGDIVLLHPELIPNLPKDVIALDWGYEADHPFDMHGAQFAAAEIPFYVCPGTSSWSSLAGRSDNALANLLGAAENGLKHGASGYLITDWGDYGHWQTLPTSYLGYIAGAAYAWALDANRNLDITEALNRHAFRDRAGIMGCISYQLGNVYKYLGVDWENCSGLFLIYQKSLNAIRENKKIRSINFPAVLELIDNTMKDIQGARMERSDAGLILKEIELTARMMKHACYRGMLGTDGDASLAANLDQDLKSIIDDYREVWLVRNRPGGLDDSVARLEKARLDYLS